MFLFSKINLLFQNPELAGQSFGKQCFISFGESIVKKAVHAGGPYKKDVTSILCLFESKFALLKKPPMNKSRLAKNQQRAPKTNKQRKASPASDPKNGTKPRGRFIPGDRIMVVGLQNSKELNGQLGHVSGEFTKNGRHPIILDSDSTRKLKLAVKPENLKPVIESVSSGCDDDTSGCDSLPSLTPRFPNGTFPPMDGSPESDDSSNSDSDAFVAPLWAGGRQESSYSEDDDSVPPLFCPEKDDSGSDSSSGDDDSVPPLHSREESDSDSSPPPLFSGEGGSKIDRSSRTASSDSTNDSGDDENSDGVPDLFHRAEYDDSSSSDDSE